MAHGMPKTFEKDNDGSTMYRINVEPEFDPENPETQIGWSCYEIRVFGEVTKSNLEHVFIRSQRNRRIRTCKRIQCKCVESQGGFRRRC